MNWNDVRYFLAVTRQGGLTGAAREVKASASTVARRIETLEFALKTRLFERRPEGYELTDAGRAMVEKATAIETAMHELEGSFCGHDGSVSGTVRIITVDALAHRLLMPSLPALQEAYPDLSLGVVVNAASFAQLPQRETDIGLRLCRPEQGNYVVRRIGMIAFGLYASSDYLKRYPVREDQLPITGHRLITWGDPLSFLSLPKTLRSWVDSGVANLTVDSMQAQLLAMKAGNGMGVLPCILADKEEGLVRVKPDLCRQEDPIWLIVHEGVRGAKRIRVVCEFLETIVKQGQRALSGGIPNEH